MKISLQEGVAGSALGLMVDANRKGGQISGNELAAEKTDPPRMT